jgi:hypothetical protein
MDYDEKQMYMGHLPEYKIESIISQAGCLVPGLLAN